MYNFPCKFLRLSTVFNPDCNFTQLIYNRFSSSSHVSLRLNIPNELAETSDEINRRFLFLLDLHTQK